MGRIRVIAGTAGGLLLEVPGVPGLRPTSDRARESLFNVLGPRLPGARVLDVFAGTGALGIEALSRGAASAVFVERSGRAREALERNLRHCGLADRSEIVGENWRPGLEGLARAGGPPARFDLALFDPPYRWEGARRCLELLAAGGLLAPDGLAVVEHRRGAGPGEVEGWERTRVLEVGDTAFSMYRPGLERAAGREA